MVIPVVIASKNGGIFVSKRTTLAAPMIVIAAIVLSFLSIDTSFVSSTNPSQSTPSQLQQPQQRPNIVFLIDESTDGRTYRPSFEAIDLINIRRLFDPPSKRSKSGNGSAPSSTKTTAVQFDTHYVTAPVCAASRASIWSGKYPHKIPHLQARTGMRVEGVWNNFEGLPMNYTDKIHDVLKRAAGYEVRISGKTDWVTGGHSLDNRLSAWTMYTGFPYNTKDDQAGFANEYGMCTGNGTIIPSNSPHQHGYYSGDWKALNKTTAWISDRGREQAASRKKGELFTPFFAYQGMNIVHPAYFTSSYWFHRVNHSAVTAPVWKPLEDLHPCDYQATMLKGCLPSNSSEAPSVYSQERKKRIRSIYYAMILEFDSMVGAYLDALEAIDGLTENTIFVLTSDHGDMQMEHQQFYKHVAYDASSRVPLIIKVPSSLSSVLTASSDGDDDFISKGRPARAEVEVEVKPFVTQPTSHVDIFPTIMDLAGVPQAMRPEGLHGESLLPFLLPGATTKLTESRNLQNATATASASASASASLSAPAALPASLVPRKRPFAVNQFHGCDIAMSWFSIIDENHYKYTVFGTGKQHIPQLFDLKADPDETTNLFGNPGFELTIHALDKLLRSVVDYEDVANDVARYTHTSLGAWVNATSGWKTILQDLRWSASFDIDANASLRAIEDYLAAPPRVYECRSEPMWPPVRNQTNVERSLNHNSPNQNPVDR